MSFKPNATNDNIYTFLFVYRKFCIMLFVLYKKKYDFVLCYSYYIKKILKFCMLDDQPLVYYCRIN